MFRPLSTVFGDIAATGWLPNVFPGFLTSTRQLLAGSRQLPHMKQEVGNENRHKGTDLPGLEPATLGSLLRGLYRLC